MQNPEDVQLATQALADRLGGAEAPLAGIILGTGLSDALSPRLDRPVIVPFADLPGFHATGVASHAGLFLYARLNGAPVLVQEGRFHLYEGYRPEDVCMGVRVMAGLGCKYLIITNAAGSLNPLFPAGSLCCLCDMINHTGISPLAGPNCDSWGERFPDMSETFSRHLVSLAVQTALERGIELFKGVYIGVHGPEMETPAETRMYRQWGADAVGMSTVLEVIAARHMGLQCLGLSCLTNLNLPDNMQPAPIEDVIATARNAAPQLADVICGVVGKLALESRQSGAAL